MLIPRLKQKYIKEIIPSLKKEGGYSSPMQVPKLLAIHISQGLAEAKTNQKLLDRSIDELTLITGQKAVPTVARKAISNFKLRAGVKIGARVTLRGARMYEFLDRFVNFALPRSRDFSGISDTSFDQQGNYTCGIKEQIIFPEISMDKIDKIRGMNITFVTSAEDRAGSYSLLKALGMPFKNMHKA
jgi:large subunit ribosomal protein L5